MRRGRFANVGSKSRESVKAMSLAFEYCWIFSMGVSEEECMKCTKWLKRSMSNIAHSSSRVSIDLRLSCSGQPPPPPQHSLKDNKISEHNNNNNVHLSCAYQRRECSHHIY